MNNGFNWLKGLFKQPTTSNAKYRSPDFYQVKPTDKSLADVSTQVGVPLPDLVQYNQNAKTLPPVGSYISLNPSGNIPASTLPSYAPNSFTNAAGQVNQYTPKQTTATGYTPNSFTNSLGQVPTAEIVSSIQNSPVMPSSIPAAVLSQLSMNGQPVTPQQMTSLGYTLDTNTGTWKNGSTAQTTTNNQPAYMQNVNYNGKIMPAWQAELRQKRAAGLDTRNMSYREQRKAQNMRKEERIRQAQLAARLKAAQRVVNPAEAGNAADTNTTTLELRLGSG